MPESAIRDLTRQLMEVARQHIAYSQVADFMNHLNSHLSALSYVEEVHQRTHKPRKKHRRKIMGCHPNVTFEKFPKQGKPAGTAVMVFFHYGVEEYPAKFLRDDMEDPWLTIFQLEDGRVIMATECQYRFTGD